MRTIKEAYAGLSEREREQVFACQDYTRDHPDAGLPGHSLMVLVSRLTVIIAWLVQEKR